MDIIKRTTKLLAMSVAAMAGLFSQQAFAEDIELYVNNQLAKKENARVMILFDTSGSMARSATHGGSCYYYDRYWDDGYRYRYRSMTCNGTYGNDSHDNKCYKYDNGYKVVNCSDNKSRLMVAKEAISKLIDESSDIDMGLARFYSEYGGYIVAGIGSDKSTLKSKLNAFPASGWTPLAESTSEIYRYFSGSSKNYANNRSGRDTSIENGSKYRSPFENLVNGTYKPRCDNNAYLIVMTDGDPTRDTGADNYIKGLLHAKEGVYPSSYKNNHLANIARYMAQYDVYPSTQVDERVYTYTIGFGNGMSSNGTAILQQTAHPDYGNGSYKLAANATELAETLKATFNEIREVSGTFSSPSVATSQSDNTRSQDAIYYAMFLPKAGSSWRGNIKKLKVNGDKVVDQFGNIAIDANGAIKEEAYTYWSSYAANSDADGNNVAKGGLNQWFKHPSERPVYTDSGSGLVEFKDTNSTIVEAMQNQLTVSEEEAKELILWSLGNSGEKDNTGKWLRRDDVMGDPLHSKPAAINYEVNGEAVTHLIFGTNAGYVHFFSDDSDTKATEKWSFIPQELYKIIPKLQQTSIGKYYGMDLTPTIHFDDANGDGMVNEGDSVWAFIGMRRGGNSYYALDITNPNRPELMWQISGNQSSFAELGQSWSIPKVAYVNLKGYETKPLLIFGAGYDREQYEGEEAGDVGAGIYMVDAQTGTKVWSSVRGGGALNTSFPGVDSITGSVATLDSDYDGYTDRLYASDVGGNIWRFDLPGNEPFGDEPWSVFKFAELGGSGSSDRKFFYEPEVSRTYYSEVTEVSSDAGVLSVSRKNVPFDAVVVGSGNRTNPLGQGIADHLYMIRDKNVVTRSQKLSPPETIEFYDLMPMTENTFGALLDDYQKFVEQEQRLASYDGWYYQLNATEKALAKPSVIGGVAYFPTFTPGVNTDASSCSLTGGLGSLYAFHLHYGVKIYQHLKFNAGDTIPPTPQLIFNENEDGKSQFLLIGVGAGDGAGVIKAKSINDNAVPMIGDDGNINLTGEFAGFRTHRSYIYRDVENKVF